MDIFNNYFSKLEEVYKKEFNSLPTVTHDVSLRKELLVGEANEDDEIQWKSAVQTEKQDWMTIENHLHFALNDELKEYYSTFYFFFITGQIAGAYVRLYSVGGKRAVGADIIQHYKDGKYDFPSSEIFLIGEAQIGGNDDLFVYYDNKTKEVFCYDREKADKKVLASSLKDFFSDIQADY